MKPEVRIEDWKIAKWQDTDTEVLHGTAINHYIWGTDRIRSSAIVNKDFANNRVETLNTIYLLGEPMDETKFYREG